MNILMISDVYFPRINGVSTSIETFRHELAEIGTRSTLIAPAYPQSETTDTVPDLIRIPSSGVPRDPEDRLMSRRAIRHWLENSALAGKYDLVHIQTPFIAHYAGLEIAKTLKIPAIASYHTYFEEYLHHYVPFLPRQLTKAVARRFSRSQCNVLDALVVPSRAMADTLLRYGVKTPLEIIPTGLRHECFRPGNRMHFRLQHQIEQDRPVLLFVGRVAHEKNIGFLLDVVASIRHKIPNILLLITGEGPALDSLREETYTRELSHHIRFLGYLDRKHTLIDCYRAADIFVFASRTETQGLVLLEAMAQGIPVVALSAMGTRDILEHTPGAVVAEEDAEDFGQKVIGLLENRHTLERYGQQAEESARNWAARKMAVKMQNLYQTVCSSHGAKQQDNQPTQAAI